MTDNRPLYERIGGRRAPTARELLASVALGCFAFGVIALVIHFTEVGPPAELEASRFVRECPHSFGPDLRELKNAGLLECTRPPKAPERYACVVKAPGDVYGAWFECTGDRCTWFGVDE